MSKEKGVTVNSRPVYKGLGHPWPSILPFLRLMTEYTTDPEAIAHYLAARSRTANWVDSITGKALVAPSAPPSLVSDTDDGLSSQDSDAESSHSLPPRMVLRYPDGRPDVAVSAAW